MKPRSVRKFKETVEFRALPLNRLKSHRYFPVAVISLVILLAACIHVWQRVVVISLVKEVSALEKENRALVDDAHKVQSDITALSMSSRIERYAADSLGLQRVQPDNLFTITSQDDGYLVADEWSAMISSIKRIADFLPAVTEAKAEARELEPIRFDADEEWGDGR
jgi:cell division protein FtsL